MRICGGWSLLYKSVTREWKCAWGWRRRRQWRWRWIDVASLWCDRQRKRNGKFCSTSTHLTRLTPYLIELYHSISVSVQIPQFINDKMKMNMSPCGGRLSHRGNDQVDAMQWALGEIFNVVLFLVTSTFLSTTRSHPPSIQQHPYVAL